MSDRQNRYIDFKFNGRLFPTWILANFPKFKLPEIVKNEDVDPCNIKQTKELRIYQLFLSQYLDFRSPYRDILIYHGLGSGKTASAINIYNMLYNYTPGWNVFILTKASLRETTWMKELQEFLKKDDLEYRFKNIVFISYDSPTADRQFMDKIKNADTSKKMMYIVDEAHNFIRNVYSNINSKKGKRAQTIYDYIINDKKENDGVRVVLLSGTPAINTPYELALLFNLLRPGIFPKSESMFNQIFLSTTGFPKISDTSKNMFQRRIQGLVSYYIGATPDFYAEKNIDYIDVEMSDYQTDIYNHFEEIENNMAKATRAKSRGGSSMSSYMSYTRQSANFVFPQINQWVTGETRPRPSQFSVNENDGELLSEGKLNLDKNSEKVMNVNRYIEELNKYVKSFEDYLDNLDSIDKKKGYTLVDDVKTYHEKYNDDYKEFHQNEKKKSGLYNELHKCSAKMLYIVFNILKSKGPVLVYSNYVLIEGLQIFKIYLKCFGFSMYEQPNKGVDHFRYVEFHGSVDEKQRLLNLDIYNHDDNLYGKLVKIIMISPAGAEGLSLKNTRQVHLMEPYWHEVRMIQMIGRAVRQCSHKMLPREERQVDIFRYKSIRKSKKETADQFIENLARSKEGLIESFCEAVKEAAIDCSLFKAHNMIASEYKCFQFDEQSLFDDQIGPAYKDDFYDDMKINNGSNSPNSSLMSVRVYKIKAVIQLNKSDNEEEIKYSDPKNYWYNSETGIVYDYDLKYPQGKVALEDNLPKKINKDTYVIDKMIPIPLIVDNV